MSIQPPRHIVWSTDHIDLRDPFQRRWYIRQVLMHGRAEDIRTLDLDEVENQLEELHLPPISMPYGNSFWRHVMLQGKGLLTTIQRDLISFFAQIPDQEQFFLTGDTALLAGRDVDPF